jgi:uncharacterized protein (TIGR02265 family)
MVTSPSLNSLSIAGSRVPLVCYARIREWLIPFEMLVAFFLDVVTEGEMARVKGTMLLGLVKTVRADRTNTYDPYLSDLDRDFISRQVLPSSWYPFEEYKKTFSAVIDVLTKGDMELVRKMGQAYGADIVSNVYKNLVIEGNPMESLKKYRIVFNMFFDFGEAEFEAVSENSGRLSIRKFDPEFEAFYYIFMGWVEECLELSGAKNPRGRSTSRSWADDPETTIEFSWTM